MRLYWLYLRGISNDIHGNMNIDEIFSIADKIHTAISIQTYPSWRNAHCCSQDCLNLCTIIIIVCITFNTVNVTNGNWEWMWEIKSSYFNLHKRFPTVSHEERKHCFVKIRNIFLLQCDFQFHMLSTSRKILAIHIHSPKETNIYVLWTYIFILGNIRFY